MKPRFKYWNPGYQEIKPEPMYAMEMRAGHSDVCGQTLIDNGHAVPPTPDYKTWANLVGKKQRCGRCFAALKGASDLAHHNQTNHLGAAPYFPACTEQEA